MRETAHAFGKAKCEESEWVSNIGFSVGFARVTAENMNEPTKRVEKPPGTARRQTEMASEPARLPLKPRRTAELAEGFFGQERALRALKIWAW